MNKYLGLLFLLATLGQSCKSTNNQDNNLLETAKKVILIKEDPKEFIYWELEAENKLWEFELGALPALSKYRDSLKLVLGRNKFELAIQKESIQNLEKSAIELEENGDKINALLVHTGSLGKIRRINYLESEILNYQSKRFPLLSHPTEFHGFILENKDEGKIRVYFGSSDTEWPPKPTVIINELEKELNRGWKLIFHLHNHFCKEEENYIGILAPSLADAQYYKMLKENFNLDKALITNGFHTVEIDSSDFEKFESH